MIINVAFEDPEHLDELLDIKEVKGIYLPGDRIFMEDAPNLVKRCHEKGKSCYYAFPFVFRKEALVYFQKYGQELKQAGFDGFLIRSLDEADYVREKELSGERIFDAGMYTWNQESMQMMKSLGADVLTAPYELNQRELNQRGMQDTELVVYGYLPVMISAGCLCLNTMGCQKGKNENRIHRLKDRKGICFPAENRCRFCYNVIYNSVPLWLLDRRDSFSKRIRFQFSVEEKGLPAEILGRYVRGERKPEGAFTRGHFERGVE